MQLLDVAWVPGDDAGRWWQPVTISVVCSCGRRGVLQQPTDVVFGLAGDVQARCPHCGRGHTFTRDDIEAAPRA